MSDTLSGARAPAIPEALLVPLLDTAGDVLRDLDPSEVPASLRTLVRFDPRGLARGAARQQLRRAIELDAEFRSRATERFVQRPEAAAVLESWNGREVVAAADTAAERGDLPLLASVVYSAHPDGWEFALGVVCGAFARDRRAREENADAQALELRVDALEEARRRAEVARADATDRAERAEEELREERRTRRGRETEAARQAEQATRRADEAEQSLALARAGAERAETARQQATERARATESELGRLRTEQSGRDAASKRAPTLRPEDVQVLADAAELGRRLARGLEGVVEQARRRLPDAAPPPASAPTQAPAPASRARRASVPVPPGLVAESREGVQAMLRVPRVAVLVDGYNVTMEAWPASSAAEQRERLVQVLAELAARARCPVTAVFDGADVGAMPAPRRQGVRVVFSAPNEEADAVIVREARAMPLDVPVVVVSSDAWVQEHSTGAGARAVSSQAFLRAIRS